jgi:CheY-like chemotaxis protein
MSETSSPSSTQHDAAALRARLDAISEQGRPPGLTEILTGLDTLIAHMAQTQGDDDRLGVLLRGLHAVADVLAQPVQAPAPRPISNAPKPQGLAQFLLAFRTEAQKRLKGLSISMMGLFGQRAGDQAIDQSAQHLHALRGGAAMLGLASFAQLAGAMEDALVTMRKIPMSRREWPTRPLMRGFQLLEEASEESDVHVPPEHAAQVISELREAMDLLKQTGEGDAQRPAHAEPVRERELAPLPAAPLTPRLEQRVLIVDDVEMIAASVGFVLSELDVPMDLASDGEDALQMLRARPYSLVITDIAMPYMDGIALTRLIRKEAGLANIPVILLTALDQPQERDAGLQAGASDYIIKGSIGGGELVERVRGLLKTAPMVPASPPGVRKRILIAEDAETVAASIAFVLSEAEFDIVLTADGHEALERLAVEHFDLLLSDWQMPAMSGYDLIRAVRSSPDLPQVPIILLTSLDDDEVREQARQAGANWFMLKGEVAGGRLLEIVDRLISATQPPSPSEAP